MKNVLIVVVIILVIGLIGMGMCLFNQRQVIEQLKSDNQILEQVPENLTPTPKTTSDKIIGEWRNIKHEIFDTSANEFVQAEWIDDITPNMTLIFTKEKAMFSVDTYGNEEPLNFLYQLASGNETTDKFFGIPTGIFSAGTPYGDFLDNSYFYYNELKDEIVIREYAGYPDDENNIYHYFQKK